MDSNDLERERGITILAKNTAITYKGTKINIIDTPGHADFGGEVERVLNMCDGVLLLVDSVEGPMPQTRFVLRKALLLEKKVVVVVNKIDRASARPEWVIDSTYELFMDLGATDEQCDFPVIYASGVKGVAGMKPDELAPDLQPLLDMIIKEVSRGRNNCDETLMLHSYCPHPMCMADPCHDPDMQVSPPTVSMTASLQMMAANIDYDVHLGRIAIGRIVSGSIKKGQAVSICCSLEPGVVRLDLCPASLDLAQHLHLIPNSPSPLSSPEPAAEDHRPVRL